MVKNARSSTRCGSKTAEKHCSGFGMLLASRWGMPTYREPADPPIGLVDSTALAASVVRIEEAHAQRQRIEERRAQALKEREQRRLAAKAARRTPRARLTRDSGGVLLSFNHQSPALGMTIASTLGLVVIALPVTWMLVAFDGGMKMLALIVAPLLAFPLLGLRAARALRRPLHLYATHNGYFVAYRTSPQRPFAMGRTKHLRLDLRWDSESTKKIMPKYGDRSMLDSYCDRLSVRDVETLRRFGEATGVRVD